MSKETISISITEEIDETLLNVRSIDGVDICELWPKVKPFLEAIARLLPKLGWIISVLLIPAIDELVKKKCG